MNTKNYNSIIAVVIGLVISLTAFSQAGTYGGGSGTAEDPYQIRTPQQMNTIGINTEDYGKHFKLMNDLDMSIYTGTQYNVIGNVTDKFTGVFDGDGYVISNLTYTTTSAFYSIGVFGRTLSATIKNLGLENVFISTGGGWVGGLVGRMEYGSVTACYSRGSVTGTSWVGGLVGRNDYGSITNSYSSCSVTVTENYATAGGLVGDNDGSVSFCYSTGAVSATISLFLLGGLVGSNDGTLTACFWDTQTSGQSGGVGSGSSSGVTGKTTAEMMTLTTFTDAGWDFTDSDGDAADWWMPSDDYPRLAWEFPYGEGSGTAEAPYQIWTAKQMNSIGNNPGDWGKHFIVMDDIDMSVYSGTQYNIIGDLTTYFSGTFDGNGHVIGNLSCTRAGVDYIGVFGIVYTSTIKNLGLENVNISANNYVGGLVGWNDGTVTNCYVTGLTNGSYRIGGLVGGNMGTITDCYTTSSAAGEGTDVGGLVGWNNGGTIIGCYATGSASITYYSVGGLVGWNSGTLTDCYARGPVSGTASVGGLVGFNEQGVLTDCYSTGHINGSAGNVGGFVGGDNSGSIVSCFWDTQTSDMTDGVGNINPDPTGVTGKTTEEMMTLWTFTDAGWDFADAWGIGNGQTYPYLKPVTGINSADTNYSGTVDTEDLAILAENWLKE